MSSSRIREAEMLDVLGKLSVEVGAGLTRQQIAIAMSLLRQGVNPSAVVAITQELRKEAHYATETDKQSHVPRQSTARYA
ncbi:hypothetical protein GGF46_004644 [Coemansia sp. RSA 552]|nr:hypothetical protein GGF46_004644 [Coemansia sp. RSA 552]